MPQPKHFMELKHFKKVAEDKDKATLEHPEGHKILIAKASISPALRKQLSALPLHQYSPEGDVQSQGEEGSVFPAAGAVQGTQEGQVAPNTPASNGPGNILSDSFGGTPNQPRNAQQPLEDQPGQPSQSMQEMGSYPGKLEGVQAIQGQAESAKNLGSAISNIAESDITRQKKADQDFNKSIQDMGTEVHLAEKDVKNGFIKPNQYMENMSTGRKVATAIGLILGGAGAGITGGPNPALEFLKQQIDRNVESQKANLGAKQNLLYALQNKYKDKVIAENMHRVINANIVAEQLKDAMAQNMGPQAEAAGHQALSDIERTYAPLMMLSNARQQALGAPAGPDQELKTHNYLQAARVLNPAEAAEFEKRHIPNVGNSEVPLDSKDREFLQKKTEVQGLLDDADKYLVDTNNHGLGAFPVGASNAKGLSLSKKINSVMGEFSNLNRFTPIEQKDLYKDMVPDLSGTHFTGSDKQKLENLRDYLNTSMDTFYKQKGINTSAASSQQVRVLGPGGKGSFRATKAQLPQLLQQGYKLVQ